MLRWMNIAILWYTFFILHQPLFVCCSLISFSLFLTQSLDCLRLCCFITRYRVLLQGWKQACILFIFYVIFFKNMHFVDLSLSLSLSLSLALSHRNKFRMLNINTASFHWVVAAHTLNHHSVLDSFFYFILFFCRFMLMMKLRSSSFPSPLPFLLCSITNFSCCTYMLAAKKTGRQVHKFILYIHSWEKGKLNRVYNLVMCTGYIDFHQKPQI